MKYPRSDCKSNYEGGNTTQLVPLLAVLALSLFGAAVCAFSLPYMMERFRTAGMVGRDQNKRHKPEVVEMGGVAVVLSFFIASAGIMAADRYFHFGLVASSTLYLAAIIAVLGAAFVGAVDDVLDLRKRMKAVLPAIFALPLAVYLSGTTVNLGAFGVIDLGLWSLILIPAMITCAANASNLLEGFNGLGSGVGLIMAGGLVALSLLTGRERSLVFVIPFIAVTLPMFWLNKYPASVFPGDTFTLFQGALLAVAAIVGDLKEVGIVLFAPMIVEFFVKARTRFRAHSFADPQEDGTLAPRSPTPSISHLMIRMGAKTEPKVVKSVWALQVAVTALAVIIVVAI